MKSIAPLFLAEPTLAVRRRGGSFPIWAGAAVPVILIIAFACLASRWVAAIGVALTLFYALKLATLHGCTRGTSRGRVLAYLTLWPGLNAPTFLRADLPPPPRPARSELAFALAKLALGLALATWATRHAATAPVRWVGWIGMLGAIFTFHFGFFHVLSWCWRRAGVAAPALMRMPIAAKSLAEFWGERWNTAFAEAARRFLLRPLARRWGAAGAGVFVFLVSGLIHELAISLPARGGWGGPTFYFLLQAAGVAVEKSATGRRLGLGAGVRGWLWTLVVTALPLPLLFHAPLVERVVVPLFRFLKEVL